LRVDGPELYFRVERQTTLPVADLRRAWFLIRVYVAPLAAVAHTAERRRRLASSLATMPPETLAYKRLTPILADVRRWLANCSDAVT
jgi:hypothetical protein